MGRVGGYAVKQSVLTSAARTTDGNSSWFNVQEFDRVNFYINVTAASGNLDITLQESPDQSIAYNIEDMAITATGNYRISTNEHTKYIRISYDVSTGGSYTFQVDYVGRS